MDIIFLRIITSLRHKSLRLNAFCTFFETFSKIDYNDLPPNFYTNLKKNVTISSNCYVLPFFLSKFRKIRLKTVVNPKIPPNCYAFFVTIRGTVLFLVVFFRKFDKKSQSVTIWGVTIRGLCTLLKTLLHENYQKSLRFFLKISVTIYRYPYTVPDYLTLRSLTSRLCLNVTIFEKFPKIDS